MQLVIPMGRSLKDSPQSEFPIPSPPCFVSALLPWPLPPLRTTPDPREQRTPRACPSSAGWMRQRAPEWPIKWDARTRRSACWGGPCPPLRFWIFSTASRILIHQMQNDSAVVIVSSPKQTPTGVCCLHCDYLLTMVVQPKQPSLQLAPTNRIVSAGAPSDSSVLESYCRIMTFHGYVNTSKIPCWPLDSAHVLFGFSLFFHT